MKYLREIWREAKERAKQQNNGNPISISIDGGRFDNLGRKLDNWEKAYNDLEKLSSNDPRRIKAKEAFRKADKETQETINGYLSYIRNNPIFHQNIPVGSIDALKAGLSAIIQSCFDSRDRIDYAITKTEDEVSTILNEQLKSYALNHGVQAPWSYYIDSNGDGPAILRIFGPETERIAEVRAIGRDKNRFDARELKEAFNKAKISNQNTDKWLSEDNEGSKNNDDDEKEGNHENEDDHERPK